MSELPTCAACYTPLCARLTSLRVLTGIKIVDMESLELAIVRLHKDFGIPNVLITSVTFPLVESTKDAASKLSVFGSTCTSGSAPRIFQIEVPTIDCFFSGTGDMLAALMVVRLKEAVCQVDGLVDNASWISGDEVDATSLPLARATEKVLASMHGVLAKTKEAKDKHMKDFEAAGRGTSIVKRVKLETSKAAEVKVVRNVDMLRKPEVRFKAEKVEVSSRKLAH